MEELGEASSLINGLKKCRHTLQEKRKLRNARKRRQRELRRSSQQITNPSVTNHLREQLANEKEAHEATKQCNLVGRSMAKTYWERWRFEMEERKEISKKLQHRSITTVSQPLSLPTVDRSLLYDPVEFGNSPSDKDVYIGRGSFGIVKCQMYRGVLVAVKEFLPHTLKESVQKEAELMAELCHPYLPLFFGMCSSKFPYILVTQYYGIGFQSVTIQRELVDFKFVSGHHSWMVLCAQVVEAFKYLHMEVNIIHNDLKGDNVLITTAQTTKMKSLFMDPDFQIIVIDFGKATKKVNGKKLSLSLSEKQQYRLLHSHLAPELIDGSVRQSPFTDIYSIGKLFLKVSRAFQDKEIVNINFNSIASKCTNLSFQHRPNISELHNRFESIVKM